MVERKTIQQTFVLDEVEKLYSEHIHANADRIYDEIHLIHPTISRATVYRNLNKLVSMGYVNHIEIPNSADCFDYVTTPHYHMKCIQCGAISDVWLTKDVSLLQNCQSKNDADITGYDILFKGICSKCKKEMNL